MQGNRFIICTWQVPNLRFLLKCWVETRKSYSCVWNAPVLDLNVGSNQSWSATAAVLWEGHFATNKWQRARRSHSGFLTFSSVGILIIPARWRIQSDIIGWTDFISLSTGPKITLEDGNVTLIVLAHRNSSLNKPPKEEIEALIVNAHVGVQALNCAMQGDSIDRQKSRCCQDLHATSYATYKWCCSLNMLSSPVSPAVNYHTQSFVQPLFQTWNRLVHYISWPFCGQKQDLAKRGGRISYAFVMNDLILLHESFVHILLILCP